MECEEEEEEVVVVLVCVVDIIQFSCVYMKTVD